MMQLAFRIAAYVALLVAIEIACCAPSRAAAIQGGRANVPEHTVSACQKEIPPTSRLLLDLKSKEVAVRRSAAAYLSRLDPDSNVEWFDNISEALTKALQDKDPDVGELAVAAFTRIRCASDPVNDRIVELLSSPRPEVARRALAVYRTNGCHAYHETAGLQILERPEASSADRLRALAMFSKEGPESGYELSLIARACDDPSAKVRLAAIKLLGSAQCSGAYSRFAALAKDKDPRVRLASVEGIYETVDTRFLSVLQAARHDSDPKVAALAKRAYAEFYQQADPPGFPAGKSKKRLPRWLDLRIGDFDMRSMSSSPCLDLKRGLFLARGGDCDGAHKRLAFASEPGAPGISEDLSKMVEEPIGDLKTGKGIGLGDLRSHVRAVLGKPTRTRQSQGRNLDVYAGTYLGDAYEEVYAYRGGRLVGISFTSDDLDSPD